jgi:uncharacterized membrane-anchored protein
MKAIQLPKIGARYWAGIMLASVFGTNTGDVFALKSGLDILGGIPILAAVVVLAYFLERRDGTKHEVWYWLAIILIRTGATNIADFACGRRFLGVDRILFSAALAMFIGGMAYLQHRGNSKPGLPRTNAGYWFTMLAAGVFGTAAGDAVLGSLGGPEAMGGVYASIILTVTLSMALLIGRGGQFQKLYYYWLTDHLRCPNRWYGHR